MANGPLGINHPYDSLNDDQIDALSLNIRAQIMRQHAQAAVQQDMDRNLFAQNPPRGQLIPSVYSSGALASMYGGQAAAAATPTVSVIEAKIRGAERAIEGNNEAVNAWLNGPGMCDRGRAVIAATYILQFERTSRTGKNKEVMLPGFGVFEVTTMYSPASLGEVGRWPEEVEVLQPVLPYPEMGYPAMRALRHRLAVQASQEEIRAQTKELETAKTHRDLASKLMAQQLSNTTAVQKNMALEEYMSVQRAVIPLPQINVDPGIEDNSFVSAFRRVFKKPPF